jgi:hypothetical protein
LRQWKIALSLAVVGALAAPFAFGTYKARPTYLVTVSVPLTAQEKERLAIELRSLDNDDCKIRVVEPAGLICIRDADKAELESGTRKEYSDHADLPKYWAMNVGVAAATAVSLFGLTYLIPMLIRGVVFLVRRYWRWLNA